MTLPALRAHTGQALSTLPQHVRSRPTMARGAERCVIVTCVMIVPLVVLGYIIASWDDWAAGCRGITLSLHTLLILAQFRAIWVLSGGGSSKILKNNLFILVPAQAVLLIALAVYMTTGTCGVTYPAALVIIHVVLSIGFLMLQFFILLVEGDFAKPRDLCWGGVAVGLFLVLGGALNASQTGAQACPEAGRSGLYTGVLVTLFSLALYAWRRDIHEKLGIGAGLNLASNLTIAVHTFVAVCVQARITFSEACSNLPHWHVQYVGVLISIVAILPTCLAVVSSSATRHDGDPTTTCFGVLWLLFAALLVMALVMYVDRVRACARACERNAQAQGIVGLGG